MPGFCVALAQRQTKKKSNMIPEVLRKVPHWLLGDPITKAPLSVAKDGTLRPADVTKYYYTDGIFPTPDGFTGVSSSVATLEAPSYLSYDAAIAWSVLLVDRQASIMMLGSL